MHFSVLDLQGQPTGFFVVHSSVEDAKKMAKKVENFGGIIPTNLPVTVPSMFQNCLMDDVTLSSLER